MYSLIHSLKTLSRWEKYLSELLVICQMSTSETAGLCGLGGFALRNRGDAETLLSCPHAFMPGKPPFHYLIFHFIS